MTEHLLADGRTVVVREIQPSDALLLRRGFATTSDASRASRFLAHKPRLTDAEVRYLTDVDQDHHIAIGAGELDELGREIPLGVARCVRLEPGGSVAEPAVMVADHAQGRGLGTLLLNELAARAVAKGITAFEATFLASNEPVHHLLEGLGPETAFEVDGEVVTARVTLARPRPEPGLFRRWLRAVTRSLP